MNVLGLGDNVVDKYVNLKIMYPGGNALNFAVFAKSLAKTAASWVFSDRMQKESTYYLRLKI